MKFQHVFHAGAKLQQVVSSRRTLVDPDLLLKQKVVGPQRGGWQEPAILGGFKFCQERSSDLN